jgi:uncharacterized protein (TIGR02246 family)
MRAKAISASSKDEAAIRMLVDAWHRATSAGDVASVLALMAEDAIFLATGRPPMRGRAAFAHALRELLKAHTVRSRGAVREVEISGDLAYCWTSVTVTLEPLDGSPPTTHTGPTLSIFRKQADAAWVLVRDANMIAADVSELALKVDNLERELMADGPGG